MNHSPLCRIPFVRMTVPQAVELDLCKFMSTIRSEANRARLTNYACNAYLRYLVGRLHGLWYGASSLLIHQHSSDYERLGVMFEGFCNEAEFLIGQYQEAA